MPRYLSKEILKFLKSSSINKLGRSFRAPVRRLWPHLAEAYYKLVPNPIDLSIIKEKLKHEKYSSLEAFKSDIKLLPDNALLFNGADHDITKSALELRDTIFAKISEFQLTLSPNPKALENFATIWEAFEEDFLAAFEYKVSLDIRQLN